MRENKTILITGGTGFIGSHIAVELLVQGYRVIILDNLSNSDISVVKKIEKITNREVVFYEVDILDISALETVFSEQEVDSVIHCAGLKAVGESVKEPLAYHENNVQGSIGLFKIMNKYNVRKIVFSSSATVYDGSFDAPYAESHPIKSVNPYGQTKIMIEQILKDISNGDEQWSVALLRYFNPIGSHESGFIGENPKGVPNNLLPFMYRVALGKEKELLIFGNDYETIDGTGVRDFIHVVDLAVGHVQALEWLDSHTGVLIANLGTGKGLSVLEIIKTFVDVSGVNIPYRFVPRRDGDIGVCFADPSYAHKELNWKAKRSIEDGCRDAWKFYQSHKEEN